ncbi:hypothetical protein J7L68_06485 [bacterium]|nr:hypothetical protein [bacterium]
MAKIFLIIIIILHLTLFFYGVYQQSFCTNRGRYILLADDTMISMKYAYNLIHHGQLVWQQGQKVMGITNPGWTAIMALTLLPNLPLRTASLPILIINLLINLSIIAIVYKIIYKLYGIFPATVIGIWLAICAPLLFWSIHGFETPLQTLLITIAMIPLIPDINTQSKFRPYISIILLTSAFVVRPDAAIIFFVFYIIVIYGRIFPKHSIRKSIITIIYSILFIFACIIAYRIYYGDWLPNTYYLKTTGGAKVISNGVKYMLYTIWNSGLIPIIILSFIAFINWIAKKEYRKKSIALGIILIVWSLYIIWTGGDAFPNGRYLLPMLPILAITAGSGIKNIRKYILPRYISLRTKLSMKQSIYYALSIMVIISSYIWLAIPISKFDGPDKNRVDRVVIAEYLEKMKLPQNTKIALFEAGTIPFLAPKFKYYDLLGKNDKYIAHTESHPGLVGHNKWDYDYSLGKFKPDIIITRDNYTGITDEFAKNIIAIADTLPENYVYFPLSLWIHPLFVQYYRSNRIPIKTPFDTHWVYARKDFEWQ